MLAALWTLPETLPLIYHWSITAPIGCSQLLVGADYSGRIAIWNLTLYKLSPSRLPTDRVFQVKSLGCVFSVLPLLKIVFLMLSIDFANILKTAEYELQTLFLLLFPTIWPVISVFLLHFKIFIWMLYIYIFYSYLCLFQGFHNKSEPGILSLAFHRSSRAMFSGGDDRTIRCWNITHDSAACIPTMHQEAICRLE